jgi:NADH-quinone oxidoreductase subunit H
MNNIIIILFLILNLMIKYVKNLIIIPLYGEKLFLVFYLLSIVYFIHLERKVLAPLQDRDGPIDTGLYGFLQPIADALKILTKEKYIPKEINIFIYFIMPFLFNFFFHGFF